MKQGASLSTDEQGGCIRAGSWLAATHRTEPQGPKPGSPSSHLLASFVPSEIFPGTSIYSTALSEGAQGSVLCTLPCRSSQHLRSPAVAESSWLLCPAFSRWTGQVCVLDTCFLSCRCSPDKEHGSLFSDPIFHILTKLLILILSRL